MRFSSLTLQISAEMRIGANFLAKIRKIALQRRIWSPALKIGLNGRFSSSRRLFVAVRQFTNFSLTRKIGAKNRHKCRFLGPPSRAANSRLRGRPFFASRKRAFFDKVEKRLYLESFYFSGALVPANFASQNLARIARPSCGWASLLPAKMPAAFLPRVARPKQAWASVVPAKIPGGIFAVTRSVGE